MPHELNETKTLAKLLQQEGRRRKCRETHFDVGLAVQRLADAIEMALYCGERA
ncbi:hypothetical protein [Dongia deserti]|uniref:hypothetical protein n=1 Tax=Dongia deserti TaxID=2268030 RepID=UPI0013C50393|nr:hypothetical protein [Dongia deserti]